MDCFALVLALPLQPPPCDPDVPATGHSELAAHLLDPEVVEASPSVSGVAVVAAAAAVAVVAAVAEA